MILLRIVALMSLCWPLLAQSTPDYLPLAVGNHWEYQLQASGGRQVWEITKQQSIKQNTWFLLDIRSTHQDADGKIRNTGGRQTWVRLDGTKLLTLNRSLINSSKDTEVVWVDFGITVGQPYASPGPCHAKATNHVSPERFTVLYDHQCNDAGLVDETFVPHVGLTSFTSESFVGARAWTLMKAYVGGKELTF